MTIHPEGKSCSELGRMLVLNDPCCQGTAGKDYIMMPTKPREEPPRGTCSVVELPNWEPLDEDA